MILEINVKSITVIEREHGMDKLLIHTHNLPPTVFPWDELACLTLDVAKGKGVKYAIENFNVQPEVIKV